MNCLGVDPWAALCAAVLSLVWLFLGAMLLGFAEGVWRAIQERRDNDQR